MTSVEKTVTDNQKDIGNNIKSIGSTISSSDNELKQLAKNAESNAIKQINSLEGTLKKTVD